MVKRFSPQQVRRVLQKYDLAQTRLDLGAGIEIEITEVADTRAMLERMVEQEGRMLSVERFPYWAEIWPASLALARWMCRTRPSVPKGWVRELGCGLGLVGIALGRLGWKIEATDYVEDALVFAAHNAEKNRVGDRHHVAYLDWGNPVGKTCDCLVASDVAYEKKNHVYLERVLRKLLAPGGRFYLSDPQRRPAARFVDKLVKQGYGHQVETCEQVWGTVSYQVDLHTFVKPER